MMEEDEETLFDQEGLLGGKHHMTSDELSVKKKKVMKTGALTMSFFSMGLCVAIAGTTLPDLGNRVDKDTEHMTFILVARSIGYLVGAAIGGILSDFFDQQLILFYVLLSTAVATVAVPWCTTLYSLATMIGIQGTAIGVLDTGGNLFCIRIWGKQSAPYMQFLHFAFGIGAFLAPLIARPFLTDSITEYSSNTSYRVLPYSSINHTSALRPTRDLSNVIKLFEQTQQYSSRWERDTGINITDARSMPTNSSDLNTTFSTTLTPVIRPKKPETVNSHHLRGDLADSEGIQDKLKKLNKDPITDKDNKNKKMDGDLSTTPISGISNNNTKNSINNNSTFNQSSQGNHTDELSMKSSPSTSTTTLTTTTTATSTTTTSTTSSTTTTTPISTASTTKESTGSDRQSLSKPGKVKDKTISLDSSTPPVNTTQAENDLVQAMIETLRNMSKIQFAYLIVGMFLLCNAGVFISLFYKDGKRCSQRPEPSHEDLIRPPDPKCFVGGILVLLFFFFFFYVGMEQTFGILLTTFAVEYPQTIWTSAQAATIIAVFWGCVALGRGISILIAHYFKAPCMMVFNLSMTFIASAILSFALIKVWFMLWLGTALLGLGMSSIFATTISWADSYYPLSGKATAVFVAGSGFGQMSIPVLTGYLYQNIDQMCLMYVVFGATCTLCVVYAALQCVASCKGTLRSHSGFMMLGTVEDAGDSLDMDLIQAGGMGRVMVGDDVRRRKHNGIDGNDTETTQLVELSD